MAPIPLDFIMFVTLAGLAILGSLGVVFSRVLVRSALWLLGTLCSITGLFILMGAEQVVPIFVLVQIVGICTLLVFGAVLADPKNMQEGDTHE